MAGRKFLDDPPVVSVAVLRFIHHDVVQLVLPALPRVRETVQDVVREILKVVEVKGAVLQLAVDVIGDRGPQHAVRPFDGRKHVGVDVVIQVLGGGDLPEELLHGLLRPLDPELFHALPRNRLGVLFVQYGEILREAEPVDFLAEEFDTEPVDGADEVIVVAAADHRGNPLPHLRRSLVGKGQAQDVGRVDAQHVHQIGITVGQSLCLAGPGPGYHPDTPLGGGHRLRLARIQTSQYASYNVFHQVLKIRNIPDMESLTACLLLKNGKFSNFVGYYAQHEDVQSP